MRWSWLTTCCTGSISGTGTATCRCQPSAERTLRTGMLTPDVVSVLLHVCMVTQALGLKQPSDDVVEVRRSAHCARGHPSLPRASVCVCACRCWTRWPSVCVPSAREGVGTTRPLHDTSSRSTGRASWAVTRWTPCLLQPPPLPCGTQWTGQSHSLTHPKLCRVL